MTLANAGRLLAALLAITGAAGCATAVGPLTCPERGGGKWIELASPHFRLQTDLPRGDAKSTLADFEAAYGAFEALVFPSAPRPRGRVDLVLFQRAEDFTAIAPDLAVGWFLPHQWGEAEPTPTIAMMGEQLLRTRRRFQHELLHRFLGARMRIAPPWLEEGLAEYWSTLRADEDSAVVGELPMNKLFITELRTLGGLTDRLVDTRVPLLDIPTLGELIGAGHATFHQPAREVAFYAASWAFVHMLQSDAEYAQRLATFVDDLAGGATAQEAWDRRFGDIPFTRLSIEFRDYVQRVELRGRKVALAKGPARAAAAPPITVRKMTDTDVHLVWARLRPWDRRENIVRAGQDFAEVRRHGPASPEALYWLALYDRRWRRFQAAERELRDALAARPDDPRLLHALADLLQEADDDRRGAGSALPGLLDRLQRLATSPQALNFIARWHLRRGERDEGLAYARRAVALGPDCWECADTLALFSTAAAQDAAQRPPAVESTGAGGGKKTVLFFE